MNACPACGAAVPAGARFCPTCAAPLQAQPEQRERKLATVLFADLQGFTSWSERFGPAEVSEMLDTYFAAAIPAVERHGGQVDRLIGDAVFATAVETGTFLEINAQPDRLDLRDSHARAAVEAGVRIVVSTDAHRVHELANLELGVFQARRGWLTKADVVNTRTWPQVRKLMKA